MRNLIFSMMVSLDGFIEGRNRELDWAIIDEELHTFVNDQQRAIDTYLYGRRTYELMADFWPTGDENPSAPEYIVEFARTWKRMPKLVFSKTLERVEWNSRLVRDNVIDEVVRLKRLPGQNMVVGGPTIAATFTRHGLIDEYHLYIHPVVLGSGTPMFPPSDRAIKLRLAETRTFASGVVYLRYRRAEEYDGGPATSGYPNV